jgi:WhiB family redox-sensing transcriptional regulator
MSLEALVRLPTWRRYAACRPVGPSPFFAADPASQAIALAVCGGCGVREACLAEALADECDAVLIFGTRGGMTASQRMATLTNSERPLDGPLEFAGRIRVS